MCVCARLLQLCPTLCDSMDCKPTRLLCPWDSLDKHTGVVCHALLQGIFRAQRLNLHLLCLLNWQLGSSPLAPPGKPPNCHYWSLLLLNSVQFTVTLWSQAPRQLRPSSLKVTGSASLHLLPTGLFTLDYETALTSQPIRVLFSFWPVNQPSVQCSYNL